MSKPKILVVDDSAFVLGFIRDHLVQAGYEVVTRDQSIGAGVAILREQPDLVLLDVVMPALGGQDVVALARKNPGLSNTRIVLFSDRDDDELEQLVKACGADGWVRKSRKPDEIIAQVARYLGAAQVTKSPTPPPVGMDEVFLFVDQDANLRSYQQTFSHYPSTVYLPSGQAALDLLSSDAPPTWVVAGLALDDMGGEELFRRAIRLADRWRRRFVFVAERGQNIPEDLHGDESPPVLQGPLAPETLQLTLSGRPPL